MDDLLLSTLKKDLKMDGKYHPRNVSLLEENCNLW